MSTLPLLTWLVLLPWLGALLLAALPQTRPSITRGIALGYSLTTLLLGLVLWSRFDPAAGYQFVERHAWIASLNITYHLGLDGLSLLLVLLTGLVAPAALLASWNLARNPRLFALLFLFLQGSALGVFLALDFFHWFIFWELSLVPAFFLIKLWGGPGASRAAYQFVIYTIGGSAFMLAGFAALYSVARTLDFTLLAQLGAEGTLAAELGSTGMLIVFLGVLLGLAVKVPLFPFHTWLPAAYAEAPTGASMFLTGVMSKMGVYGFLRILWPIFPAQLQAAAPVLLWLALGGVVTGAFAPMAPPALKHIGPYPSRHPPVAYPGCTALVTPRSPPRPWPAPQPPILRRPMPRLAARCCRYSTTASPPLPCSSASASLNPAPAVAAVSTISAACVPRLLYSPASAALRCSPRWACPASTVSSANSSSFVASSAWCRGPPRSAASDSSPPPTSC